MKPDPRAEAQRWLDQAAEDLQDARLLAANNRHHLACFHAQQSADKAVKAVLYGGGEMQVLGHSVALLMEQAAAGAPRLQELTARAATLDKLYIPTRYPNALPGGIPARAYDARDSAAAMEDAAAILQACTEALRVEGGR